MGIYIIKNNINEKVYIGQSINIENRCRTHFSKGSPDASLNQTEMKNGLHSDMRKYGRENFYYEVLEECEKDKLDEREKYWISYYDSFKNGYNGTPGGSFYDENITVGENNGRSKLLEEDVRYIRECYNNHIPFREVYEIYKNKISKKGLQNVWHFITWVHIYPEYHTEENKYWHSHQSKGLSSEQAKINSRGAISEEDVKEIRKRYDNGETAAEIWKSSFPNYAKSTIVKIVSEKSHKNVN